MAKILVTGGAGYIGSHTIVELIENGYEVVSADNYINSIPLTYERIEVITGVKVPYYEVDLVDLDALKVIFREHPDIKGIIHFGALKSVPDSVANPSFCFDNNNISTNNIAICAEEFDVKNIIFSSSCSVYGNVMPEDLPVTEDTPLKNAESPYAYTKQNGEVMLRFISNVRDINAICLRYFNPVGAHVSGELGELPSKRVNNLVPVITQAAAGVRPHFTVFGDNWNTRDGSCIRDYIHVTDIADAHVKGIALQLAGKTKGNYDIINLGSGDGVSVFEAIQAFEKACGIKAPYEVGPRRDGDVETIYSNPKKAEMVLGWTPKYGIEDMMASAWKWQLKLAELGLAKEKL
ncbi:MAG: UDP-glucose 4-epimerase GalE [Crocinitomicaceae bacterium]|nr:UDP-glucose 4-epimerase GalE [Crocinitomicaceae bacterium]|tara:strand:- start:3138 stop:4184 length:1047 start_codon:yes stop_codon:yes gene_type:complete